MWVHAHWLTTKNHFLWFWFIRVSVSWTDLSRPHDSKKIQVVAIVPNATVHLHFVSWKLNREIWNKHQFNLDFWKFAFVLKKFYVSLRSRILTCVRPSVWSAITLGHRLQRRKLCPPFGCLCETPVTFWCLAGLKTIARTWVQLQQTRAIFAICFSPIFGKYWFDAQTILPPTFIKKVCKSKQGFLSFGFCVLICKPELNWQNWGSWRFGWSFGPRLFTSANHGFTRTTFIAKNRFPESFPEFGEESKGALAEMVISVINIIAVIRVSFACNNLCEFICCSTVVASI